MPDSNVMTADTFVALLVAQLGKPYRLGAEVKLDDPDPAAFDCSELVQWAFNRAGTKITDGAWLQYAATSPVSSGIRTGDLVFLRNNPARSNGIGHVGIVADRTSTGEWRIIEARGRAWGVTNKRTLGDWRNLSTFAGVRRFPGLVLSWPQQTTYPPTLRKGSRGKWVNRLQAELKAAGYHGDILNRAPLAVDGDMGTQTVRAVKRYQKAHGLVVDGVVGLQTWRSLGITTN